MTNYITSGTLTNYVYITSNQTLTGKKTFTGGINTKSQDVSGTTDLNDDILFGVVKVVGSGNFRLPPPVDNAGVEYRFILKLTALCLRLREYSREQLLQAVRP